MELTSATQRGVLGDLPEEWEVTPVAEQFTIQLGKMLDSEKNAGTSKPFLGNRAVQWGRIDVSDLGAMRMSPTDLDRFRLRGGDLLVCEGGEVGRAAIWRDQLGECYYQKALHRLRPRRRYSPDLMLFVLRFYSDSGLFTEFVTQTSIAHLPKDKFETIPIPVPPPEEQRRIACGLSDADQLVESLGRLIAKKRRIKLGAMQKLLTGKRRLPGFEGKWEAKTLGDLTSLRMGHTPSRTVQRFWGLGHVWLSIGDLSGKYASSSAEQITAEGTLGKQAVRQGTLLMSFKLSIGRLAFAGCDLYTNEAICAFEQPRADAEYLYYALQRVDFALYGKQAVKGYTLNTESLQAVEVTCPKRDEQRAIAAVLSDMDAEIAALEARLAKARRLKRGMMQQLLTGKIRLQCGEGTRTPA